jgi:Flp pilus assembly protein TadG
VAVSPSRWLGDESGVATTVEAVIILVLLVGFFGGFSSAILAAHARSVAIAAAETAARTAAIECGLGTGSWASDATAAGERMLQDGGLQPTVEGGASSRPGSWSVVLSADAPCPTASQVTAQVTYAQRNLFPVLGPLLAGQPAGAPTIAITSNAVFPVG